MIKQLNSAVERCIDTQDKWQKVNWPLGNLVAEPVMVNITKRSPASIQAGLGCIAHWLHCLPAPPPPPLLFGFIVNYSTARLTSRRRSKLTYGVSMIRLDVINHVYKSVCFNRAGCRTVLGCYYLPRELPAHGINFFRVKDYFLVFFLIQIGFIRL